MGQKRQTRKKTTKAIRQRPRHQSQNKHGSCPQCAAMERAHLQNVEPPHCAHSKGCPKSRAKSAAKVGKVKTDDGDAQFLESDDELRNFLNQMTEPFAPVVLTPERDSTTESQQEESVGAGFQKVLHETIRILKPPTASTQQKLPPTEIFQMAKCLSELNHTFLEYANSHLSGVHVSDSKPAATTAETTVKTPVDTKRHPLPKLPPRPTPLLYAAGLPWMPPAYHFHHGVCPQTIYWHPVPKPTNCKEYCCIPFTQWRSKRNRNGRPPHDITCRNRCTRNKKT